MVDLNFYHVVLTVMMEDMSDLGQSFAPPLLCLQVRSVGQERADENRME